MTRKPQRKVAKTVKPEAKPAAKSTVSALTPTDPRDFAALAHHALARGEPDSVPDDLLQEVLAAAVKIYAAKVERRGDLKPFEDGTITATESVVAACALIRAADLNLFDVAMWFHRPAR
jgi:hypothetical protein